MRVALRTVLGGDVDDGVGAGERIELHGGDGVEGSVAWSAVAVGEIQNDPVTVDGDQRGAFDGLVTGEIGKCHASNLSGADAAAWWPATVRDGNRTAAARVVLDG